MKNIYAFLFALCVSSAVFGQLPNGSIAPDFTATDINGNTYNLYDILDQGKSVIIEISATWAGPCWDYHNTNALQDFYQAHGPAGDNTAMVFWVEGDFTTSVECITGGVDCVGGTQGDFTAGQTYPFINDDDGDISTAYQVAYYPTVFMVCSDKIVKEVGQLSAQELEIEAAVCPVLFGVSKMLTGFVVKDDNFNCVVDNGETALANWGVHANGQNGVSFHTFTNVSGQYRMFVDSLNSPYTLSFTPPNALWAACPAPPPIVITQADTFWVDHPAQVINFCPLLSTQIGTPMLRRCFENIFYVEVCNDGTAAADNAYVDVTLPEPEFLPVTIATLPFTTLSPGVYRFELGDIQEGACVEFNLVAAVACDSSAQIGETLCFEAHAYPDSLCVPLTAAWNGASVLVNATCDNDNPSFAISNVGNAPMLEALEYVIIEDDVMYSEGVFQLNAGESLPINVPNNGSTWRIEARQVPNHPVAGNPAAALEGCTVVNNFSTGFLLSFPVYDPSYAHDVECRTVIGSWDPNDKTGFPLGVSDQHLVSKNTDLDYLIRFQNTGNDTAFTVVVRDTLSAHLDPASIRLGASSHRYDFSLEQNNVLVFTFKDIKLVDSFANEPASHGFVKFKLAQKPDLADGTDIYNSAAIYFDFNQPVLTNTTHHQIGKVPHVSAVHDLFTTNIPLTVYPNPLNGHTALHTKTDMPAGATWRLFDFMGKLLATGKMLGNKAVVGDALNSEGIYYIEFKDKEGRSLGGASVKN